MDKKRNSIKSVESMVHAFVVSERCVYSHVSVSEAVHNDSIAMLVVQTPVNFENEEDFRPRIFFPFCALDSRCTFAWVAGNQ